MNEYEGLIDVSRFKGMSIDGRAELVKKSIGSFYDTCIGGWVKRWKNWSGRGILSTGILQNDFDRPFVPFYEEEG